MAAIVRVDILTLNQILRRGLTRYCPSAKGLLTEMLAIVIANKCYR
jgi:hypothetical protein